MRFYKLDEVPVSRNDVIFKESPTINAIAALILFGLAAGSIYLGVIKWQPSQGHMAPYAPYCVGAIFAVVGLFPLSNFRASLKPTNWLLRCQLGGLFIKYRAYENWRLPADTLQVVGFEYAEIAWAKLVKEHRTVPNTNGKGGNQTEFLTYIDLGLANPNLSELEANLDAERSLRPDGVIITMDFPVQVRPGGIVEIHWGAGIRPSARRALQALGPRVKILETEHRKTDLTHRLGANPEDEKAKIIALAQSGDTFGAVRLAQQAYGYSLTQAHAFVDTLVPEDSDADKPK